MEARVWQGLVGLVGTLALAPREAGAKGGSPLAKAPPSCGGEHALRGADSLRSQRRSCDAVSSALVLGGKATWFSYGLGVEYKERRFSARAAEKKDPSSKRSEKSHRS